MRNVWVFKNMIEIQVKIHGQITSQKVQSKLTLERVYLYYQLLAKSVLPIKTSYANIPVKNLIKLPVKNLCTNYLSNVSVQIPVKCPFKNYQSKIYPKVSLKIPVEITTQMSMAKLPVKNLCTNYPSSPKVSGQITCQNSLPK